MKNKAYIEAQDKESFTPLSYLSEYFSSCVDLLVIGKRSKIKVAKNAKKLTPLHLAVQASNARDIELLLAWARRRSTEFMLEYGEAKTGKERCQERTIKSKMF